MSSFYITIKETEETFPIVDKLECENGTLRQVLLLGYSNGFQVWDVENADDVRLLVSTHDGLVSSLQMLKKATSSESNADNFSNVRPLLIIAGDASLSSSTTNFGANAGIQDMDSENSSPAFVYLYSVKTHDYIHVLKFRTSVYSIRCSHRVVAISQATQVLDTILIYKLPNLINDTCT